MINKSVIKTNNIKTATTKQASRRTIRTVATIKTFHHLLRPKNVSKQSYLVDFPHKKEVKEVALGREFQKAGKDHHEINLSPIQDPLRACWCIHGHH